MMITAVNLALKRGMMSVTEVQLLKKCVSMLSENPIIINIGSSFGTSCIAILEERSDTVVFSIDKKPRTAETTNLLLSSVDHTRRIRILGDSSRVGYNFPYMVDMVFVDGNHSNDAVQRDIDSWLPKIVAGGIILFHDYKHPNLPGLTIVVDAAMTEHTKIDEKRYLIAFKV